MFSWLVEHIIGIIPFWVWLTIACTAGAGYFFAGIITMIPFLIPYKEPFKVLCVIICLGGTFMCGGDGVTDIWKAQIKEAEDKVAKAEAASADANAKLADERNKKVAVRTEYITTVKERIVKDTQIIDSECKVAPEAIKDLNNAAKNPLKKDVTK
jgi:predicted DNA repair protein MutK